MPRLLSPDDGCVQVKVPIGAGRQYNGRTIDVSDPAHVKALREAGYTVGDISGGPSHANGFRCTECGFQAFFTRCGRCGSACERAA